MEARLTGRAGTTEKSHHQSPSLKATDFSTRNIIFKHKNPVRVFEMTR